MKNHSLLFILMLSTLVSCYSQTANKDLLGKWTHVYEEDHDGLKVYQKGDSLNLPPARFRQIFVLEKDYQCKFGNLAPNDAHTFKEGSYKVSEDILFINDLNGELLFKFKVVKQGSHVLHLKKMN